MCVRYRTTDRRSDLKIKLQSYNTMKGTIKRNIGMAANETLKFGN